MRAWVCIAVLLLLPAAAPADDITQFPGLLRQPLSIPVTLPDGHVATLDSLVVRPDGPGPFPLALITNGLPRSAADLPALRPEMYISPALMFAQHGYAAVVVLRRFYGRSDGPFQERLGPCDNRNYLRPGQAAAADILAALATLREEPWVDANRTVLIGHSMGGFGVLAALATNPPGVQGGISFAGAVGSPRPGEICQPERLIAADAAFGQTAHTPVLWIFAQNDHFFGPELAQHMFEAYTAQGAPASLFAAPAFGSDGHRLIFAATETAWWPQVAAFLEAQHLPAQLTVPLPPPPALAEPAPLDDRGRSAFLGYTASRSYEKAFATDPAGHYGAAYGQRTKADAEQAAIKDCQRMLGTCAIYAVGNDIAHPPQATPSPPQATEATPSR